MSADPSTTGRPTKMTSPKGLALTGIVAFLAALMCFGKPMKVDFSVGHRQQIQLIAEKLCAEAGAVACPVTWGGKHKWFGVLEPLSAVQGRVGLDHIRQVLRGPEWTEQPVRDGVDFRNGAYLVTYASLSGTVTITSVSD
jgi:hypothetical protein